MPSRRSPLLIKTLCVLISCYAAGSKCDCLPSNLLIGKEKRGDRWTLYLLASSLLVPGRWFLKLLMSCHYLIFMLQPEREGRPPWCPWMCPKQGSKPGSTELYTCRLAQISPLSWMSWMFNINSFFWIYFSYFLSFSTAEVRFYYYFCYFILWGSVYSYWHLKHCGQAQLF